MKVDKNVQVRAGLAEIANSHAAPLPGRAAP